MRSDPCLPNVRLTTDGPANLAALQEAVRAASASGGAREGPGTVRLPEGTWPVSGGLQLPDGVRLEGIRASAGSPLSWLESSESLEEPLLHVTGSGCQVSDLGLRLPATVAGEHSGDRGTALTVGRYLYHRSPDWQERVSVCRVTVERTGKRQARARAGGETALANSVAVMGAVRGIDVENLHVRGGGTGLAVHWGAVGASVTDVREPTYHPNHLNVRGLDVRDAFEGFYLSSVHDVSVVEATLERVEIGFRLLPGDNTVRLLSPLERDVVSRRIEITGCRISWHGQLYAVRVAGWGCSPIDSVITEHPFRDVILRRCIVTTLPQSQERDSLAPARAAVVLERAAGLILEEFEFDGDPQIDLVRSDGADPTHVVRMVVGS